MSGVTVRFYAWAKVIFLQPDLQAAWTFKVKVNDLSLLII